MGNPKSNAKAKEFARARRDRYKAHLLAELDMFKRFGHDGPDADISREELA